MMGGRVTFPYVSSYDELVLHEQVTDKSGDWISVSEELDSVEMDSTETNFRCIRFLGLIGVLFLEDFLGGSSDRVLGDGEFCVWKFGLGSVKSLVK